MGAVCAVLPSKVTDAGRDLVSSTGLVGLVPSDPAVELLLRMGWWDVQHFPRTRAGAAVLTLSHCRLMDALQE